VPDACWPVRAKVRSRLHYYLADREAHATEPGARAVLLHLDGRVSETSTANVAIVRGDTITTPPPHDALPGVSLRHVRGIAESHGLSWATRSLTVDDLAAVYRRLYPSLVRTAFLLVDTREQAEEVVQEAFAKAFPKWDRLRIPEAYVRTCVVNGCRRVQRRRGLARRLVVPPIDEVRNEHDHIADAVRALPSPQREVVVLRYYLQATDAEIAATLKIALGTVKSSLHRARAALREQLVTRANDVEGRSCTTPMQLTRWTRSSASSPTPCADVPTASPPRPSATPTCSGASCTAVAAPRPWRP
jgi:RNA polymerase sigma factor (sigma-70 family)